MAKKRSGTSTRRPPEPTDDRDQIDDWLGQVRPALEPVTDRIDEMIRDAFGDDLLYAIKWNKAYYGLPERGWVIELVAYIKSVNIVFLGGVDYDLPPPLGDCERSRYLKITDVDEFDGPELRSWIDNASRVDGWSWT